MTLVRTVSRAALVLAIASSWALSHAAHATTFRSGLDDRNDVSFRSKAPLETINGKTSDVQATVAIDDLQDFAKSLKASVTVGLASLDTGIALRDDHMRKSFLQTDKYPNAVFTLTEVVSAYTTATVEGQDVHTPTNALAAGVPTHVVATGVMALHGVERDITVDDLTVTYFEKGAESKAKFPDGDVLYVAGSIDAKLSEYGIKRPRMVVLKLADEVQLTFGLALGTEVGADEAGMDGCGGCGGCGDAGCGGCGDAGCGGCGDAGCGDCGDAGCGGDGGCGDAGCGDAGCGDAGCGDAGCGA
jgi:polyisoprenoid-binding protein YceI